ncbi:MAG: endoribonuclease MazF [Desulfovibrio sp.]|nr:endoribonuclease MazF [Desulfovibrio sp.]
MVTDYIPARNDLIWLEFSPQAGHEQAGHRPALVLSPYDYNRKSGLALVCPITTKTKGYPFDVHLPDGLPISGIVQSDQLRSLDWRQRKARLIGQVPHCLVYAVLDRIAPLLGL